MNKEDGRFNGEFQDLMDSYGTQGIAVRMLLVMRPRTPTTTTLTVFPSKKKPICHMLGVQKIYLNYGKKHLI